jgi:5-methylcytosine-specific restriction endonuclease McrA
VPIRLEQRGLYPRDWPAISRRIRARAGWVCETPGCGAAQGAPHPITGARVVLTVAHLNHDPSDCRDENLRALCQRCHNRYDAPMRAAGRRARSRAALGVGELPLTGGRSGG